MTSPVEPITIQCPECGHTFNDWYRPSVNLGLDDFDEDYLNECSSAICPACGHKVDIDILLAEFEEGESSP
jgi:hypothetical protein